MGSVKKIAFIGGGSAYIPLIIEQLAADDNFSALEEVVFIAPRVPNDDKIAGVSAFCRALLNAEGKTPKITLSNTADNCIADSDIVFGIFRAGGLPARHLDETLGNDLGILGQESQGFGGFSSAIRNLAVLKDIAPTITQKCPNALYINLTNPAGIMTRAARKLGLNAVGICDVPYAMKTKIANFLRLDKNKLDMDYIGLNHLGWIIDLKYNNKSILNDALSSPNIANMLKSIKQSNIPDIEMDVDFVRAIRAIPSSYLYYYYCKDEMIAHLANAKKSRAQRVMEDNKRLYRHYEELNISVSLGAERGAYLLGAAVYDFIANYFFNSKSADHAICFPNGTALPFLPAEAIIETQTIVRDGKIAHKLSNYHIDGHIKSLIATVAEYETMVVDAGLIGDSKLALSALATHPLIANIAHAKELLSRALATFSDHLPQFSKGNAT